MPRAPKVPPQRAVRNRTSEADDLIGQLTKEPAPPVRPAVKPPEPDLTES